MTKQSGQQHRAEQRARQRADHHPRAALAARDRVAARSVRAVRAGREHHGPHWWAASAAGWRSAPGTGRCRTRCSRGATRTGAPCRPGQHGALRVVLRQRRARQPRGDLPATCSTSRTWPTSATSGRSTTSSGAPRGRRGVRRRPAGAVRAHAAPRTTSRRWPPRSTSSTTRPSSSGSPSAPEQVYVNTWHGVPLKHMGFDMPERRLESRNITRNFLSADYLLSANAYHDRHDVPLAPTGMQGIFRGAVIEEGQPRIDRRCRRPKDPAAATVGMLESRGVDLEGRQVVLYAPTWRGDTFLDPQVNAAAAGGHRAELQERARRRAVRRAAQGPPGDLRRGPQAAVGDADFLVPNSVPDQPSCSASPTCWSPTTRASSSTSSRPAARWSTTCRTSTTTAPAAGSTCSDDELPGPTCDDVPELAKRCVRRWRATAGPRARGGRRRVYCAKDDGDATARGGRHRVPGRRRVRRTRVRRDFGTDKETLLHLPGQHEVEGITTSALNLLRNLDYDRYDVTAFWAYSRGPGPDQERRPGRPPGAGHPRAPPDQRRARAGPRGGSGNSDRGAARRRSTQQHRKFWRGEWQRMFGDAAVRPPHRLQRLRLLRAVPVLGAPTARSTSIWLHNDMTADMQRETVGEQAPRGRGCSAVFSTYRHFDHLVSVSPELDAGQPREASPRYAAARAVHLRAQHHRRRAGAADGRAHATRGPREARRATRTRRTRPAPSDGDVRHRQHRLDDHARCWSTSRSATIIREARSRVRLAQMPVDGGHDRRSSRSAGSPRRRTTPGWSEAFAQVHERHPDTRLVILGGGKLEDELHELVVSLGLGAVRHAGGPGRQPLRDHGRVATASCSPATTRASRW